MKISETGTLKLDLLGSKFNGIYYQIQKKNVLYEKKFLLGNYEL